MIQEGNRYYSECFGKGYFLEFVKCCKRTNIRICKKDGNGEIDFIDSWDKARTIKEYYKNDLKEAGSFFNSENGEITLYKNWDEVVSKIPETAVLEDFFREKIFELSQKNR